MEASVKHEDETQSRAGDMELIKYKMQLTNERDNLDPIYEHGSKLLLREIERIEAGGKKDEPAAGGKDDVINIHTEKPIKLCVKVKVPIEESPRFNFVGKLLGPKGASLKALQTQTMTKMSILGRGSMKDKAKEDEFRKEGGKYSHLNDELHVKIEVFAAPWDAYARMSNSLIELQKHMVPDPNDPVSMGQRQMMYSENGMLPPSGSGPMGRGRGGAPMRGGGGGGLLSSPRGGSGPPSRGGPMGGMGRGMPPGRGQAAPNSIPRGRSRGLPSSRGPPSRGGPSRGSMPLMRGGGGGGRGAPSQYSAPESFSEYGGGYDSYPSQSFEDSYTEPVRHEPPREPPMEHYREPSREFREPVQSYETNYESSGSRDSTYYDYGHGAGAADNYADAYGDRHWDSGKSAPPSRVLNKSYRSQAPMSRPY